MSPSQILVVKFLPNVTMSMACLPTQVTPWRQSLQKVWCVEIQEHQHHPALHGILCQQSVSISIFCVEPTHIWKKKSSVKWNQITSLGRCSHVSFWACKHNFFVFCQIPIGTKHRQYQTSPSLCCFHLFSICVSTVFNFFLSTVVQQPRKLFSQDFVWKWVKLWNKITRFTRLTLTQIAKHILVENWMT